MSRGDRIACIGLGALAGLAYGPVLWRLGAAWWNDPEYSHGLICAPLAAGIVWARRDRLARLQLAPSAAGLAGACVSIALLLVGTLGAELFLTRASLLLFIGSSIVFVRLAASSGRRVSVRDPRASIPIPALLMTHVTLPLQFAPPPRRDDAVGRPHSGAAWATCSCCPTPHSRSPKPAAASAR
jgi:hypothetical protein